MAKAIKLSTAQLALLKDRSGRCISSYKPCQKLAEYGFVKVKPEKDGYYVAWSISTAGEAYLAEHDNFFGK